MSCVILLGGTLLVYGEIGFIFVTVDCYRRGPAQDVPFDIILCYIAKTIPTLLE